MHQKGSFFTLGSGRTLQKGKCGLATSGTSGVSACSVEFSKRHSPHLRLMELRDLRKAAATRGVKSCSLPSFPSATTPVLSCGALGPAAGLRAKSKAERDLGNLLVSLRMQRDGSMRASAGRLFWEAGGRLASATGSRGPGREGGERRSRERHSRGWTGP